MFPNPTSHRVPLKKERQRERERERATEPLHAGRPAAARRHRGRTGAPQARTAHATALQQPPARRGQGQAGKGRGGGGRLRETGSAAGGARPWSPQSCADLSKSGFTSASLLFPKPTFFTSTSSPGLAKPHITMDEDAASGNSHAAETFDTQDLIHAIFKLVWRRRAEKGRGGNEDIGIEPAPETSRRNRSTTANASALKVSCELLRIFVTEAIQRSAFIAEAEDATVIEPTHLERVLPQLLLDF